MEMWTQTSSCGCRHDNHHHRPASPRTPDPHPPPSPGYLSEQPEVEGGGGINTNSGGLSVTTTWRPPHHVVPAPASTITTSSSSSTSNSLSLNLSFTDTTERGGDDDDDDDDDEKEEEEAIPSGYHPLDTYYSPGEAGQTDGVSTLPRNGAADAFLPDKTMSSWSWTGLTAGRAGSMVNASSLIMPNKMYRIPHASADPQRHDSTPGHARGPLLSHRDVMSRAVSDLVARGRVPLHSPSLLGARCQSEFLLLQQGRGREDGTARGRGGGRTSGPGQQVTGLASRVARAKSGGSAGGRYFGRACVACSHQHRQQAVKNQQLVDYKSGNQPQDVFILDSGGWQRMPDAGQAEMAITTVSVPDKGLPKLTGLLHELSDPTYYDTHRKDMVSIDETAMKKKKKARVYYSSDEESEEEEGSDEHDVKTQKTTSTQKRRQITAARKQSADAEDASESGTTETHKKSDRRKSDELSGKKLSEVKAVRRKSDDKGARKKSVVQSAAVGKSKEQHPAGDKQVTEKKAEPEEKDSHVSRGRRKSTATSKAPGQAGGAGKEERDTGGKRKVSGEASSRRSSTAGRRSSTADRRSSTAGRRSSTAGRRSSTAGRRASAAGETSAAGKRRRSSVASTGVKKSTVTRAKEDVDSGVSRRGSRSTSLKGTEADILEASKGQADSTKSELRDKDIVQIPKGPKDSKHPESLHKDLAKMPAPSSPRAVDSTAVRDLSRTGESEQRPSQTHLRTGARDESILAGKTSTESGRTQRLNVHESTGEVVLGTEDTERTSGPSARGVDTRKVPGQRAETRDSPARGAVDQTSRGEAKASRPVGKPALGWDDGGQATGAGTGPRTLTASKKQVTGPTEAAMSQQEKEEYAIRRKVSSQLSGWGEDELDLSEQAVAERQRRGILGEALIEELHGNLKIKRMPSTEATSEAATIRKAWDVSGLKEPISVESKIPQILPDFGRQKHVSRPLEGKLIKTRITRKKKEAYEEHELSRVLQIKSLGTGAGGGPRIQLHLQAEVVSDEPASPVPLMVIRGYEEILPDAGVSHRVKTPSHKATPVGAKEEKLHSDELPTVMFAEDTDQPVGDLAVKQAAPEVPPVHGDESYVASPEPPIPPAKPEVTIDESNVSTKEPLVSAGIVPEEMPDQIPVESEKPNVATEEPAVPTENILVTDVGVQPPSSRIGIESLFEDEAFIPSHREQLSRLDDDEELRVIGEFITGFGKRAEPCLLRPATHRKTLSSPLEPVFRVASPAPALSITLDKQKDEPDHRGRTKPKGLEIVQEQIANNREVTKPHDLTSGLVYGQSMQDGSLLREQLSPRAYIEPSSIPRQTVMDSFYVEDTKATRTSFLAYSDGTPNVLSPAQIRERRVPPPLQHPLAVHTGKTYTLGQPFIKKELPLREHVAKDNVYKQVGIGAGSSKFHDPLAIRDALVSTQTGSLTVDSRAAVSQAGGPLPEVPSAACHDIRVRKERHREVEAHGHVKMPSQKTKVGFKLPKLRMLRYDDPLQDSADEEDKSRVKTSGRYFQVCKKSTPESQPVPQSSQAPALAPATPCTSPRLARLDKERFEQLADTMRLACLQKELGDDFSRESWDLLPSATQMADTRLLRVTPSVNCVQSWRVQPTSISPWLDQPQVFISRRSPRLAAADHHHLLAASRQAQGGKVPPGLVKDQKMKLAPNMAMSRLGGTYGRAPPPDRYVAPGPVRRQLSPGMLQKYPLGVYPSEAEMQSYRRMAGTLASGGQAILTDKRGVPFLQSPLMERTPPMIHTPHMMQHVQQGRRTMQQRQTGLEAQQDYNDLLHSILNYEVPGVRTMQDDFTGLIRPRLRSPRHHHPPPNNGHNNNSNNNSNSSSPFPPPPHHPNGHAHQHTDNNGQALPVLLPDHRPCGL